MNGDETGVDCGGSCSPCPEIPCGEGTTDPQICIGSECAAAGAEVCVPVYVGNFNTLFGFQFSLSYAAANLEYTRFMAAAPLQSGATVGSPSDGTVNLVWNDPDLVGVTFPADQVAFEICFTVQTVAATPLTFRDQANTLRFFNSSGSRIPGGGSPGSVNQNCGNTPTCTDGIMNGGETGVDCGGPNCTPCVTCNDGIMNGDETGVDCGGSCPNVCPASPLNLTVGNGTAQVGQQVCVDVTAANFTNIANLALTLNFNSTVLSLASVTANPALPGFGAGNFTTTGSTIAVNYTPASAQTLPAGARLFTVCFNVLTGDETPLTVTNATATNNGGTMLTVNTTPGTINSGGVVTYDNFTLVVSNETGAMGTEVCLDVDVYNLTDFAGLQFALGYDATKLEFVSATGTGQLPNLQIANPEPGILRVIWFDPNVGSNDVPDGQSILSACFRVLQACNTPVIITEQLPQFRIRATNSSNEAITPVDRVDGSVNSGTPCGGTAQNLILQLGSGEGTLGEEVCVDLKATNFTSLTNLSFSIAYDASKVTFSRATNFGLTSITAANVTNPAAGQVAFNWTAPGSAGQTLAANRTVVSLCFTVDRYSVTPLSFSNVPTPILARNASNQPVGVVPSGGTINPNAPNVTRLTMQVGSTQVNAGEDICLPVIAFQATDLVSFQYTINYDPAVLQYLGTGPNYAFNAFSNGSVNNSQPGVLRVAWADPMAAGNSVPDGSALYTICFRVLETDCSLITFGNSPTAIEFEDVNNIVEADLLNGQVNCTSAPVIGSADVQSPTCAGEADGSIELTVSGGNNLNYVWSPNVSTSATATGLSPGTYNVTVTNPRTNQSTTGSYTITEGEPFQIQVAMVSGVSCFGERDGQILIATVGNTGPYLFDWIGSLADGTPSQTMLAGGNYSVTVTNDNGCVRVLDNIGVAEPAAVNITGQLTNITAGPGRIDATVTGGRTPYRYSWTGPNGFTSTMEDIEPTEAGTYCLTAIDNSNCSDIQCFALIRALAIVDTDVDPGCFGQNNGSIDLTVIGGGGTYSYLWSDGTTTIASTQDIDSLAAGDYTVTVTSGSNQVVQTITVEPATQIRIPGMVTNATTGSNGGIVVTPSGGNAPYTFLWADGPTTQNRSGLSAGEYCLTATDASDCTFMRCYTVGAAAPTITGLTALPASCSDADDGTIRLTMTNGLAPIMVRVEPVNFTYTDDDNNIEVNVPAGEYTVFLTDDQGAMVSTMVTVGAPAAIAAASTVTSDTEDTNCSGMISLNIQGGTGPYTAAWDNGASGLTISTLCAGMYTATITDANGCTFEAAAVEVGRVDEEVTSITDVACADGTEGSIDVTITGGVTPYTFSWTRMGSADVLSTMEDLSPDDVEGGVTAGTYTLTVSDATGATLIRNYTVGISTGFSVTAAVDSDYNGFGVSCSGASDGRIVLTISGQGPFTYEYILNEQIVGVDSVLENAAAGLYTITVLDEGNCQITRTVEVTAPPAITLTESFTNISCGSTNDGSIMVTPAGGVGPYSFAWSNGANTPRISALGTGTYSVTVTGANGCTTSTSVSLTAPEDLAITFEATDATEGCNGSVRILPLGGSGNYRYTWPELPNQGNSPLAEGLCPGEYTIQVTDDNECQTVTMIATVLDRRFPCLSAREVITPNGDGLNEAFVLFCSNDVEAINNTLQIFNRWGQLVYKVNDYDCSSDEQGTNCFEGRTNDGSVLPEGPYYYIFDFTNPQGDAMQQRGSLTIVRD